ncbi:hypothetical protein JQ760_028040 (plasmid) [Klebsiella pneumoniae]|uniref:hypothetical protein n=1 Tax=Klebsiella pneumoniae TaxID=573 RepID=UPI001FAC183C|nr:hypothetical protein [Klebsiella pneumoniae]MCI8108489.1 hypothetical protein [Klebsiella pneumoniae]
MEKMFWAYLAVVVVLLSGFLYYRRKCVSMIREYRRMKGSLNDHQKAVAFIYQDLIPGTVLNQARLIQEQRHLLKHMLNNLAFASENPDVVDLISSSYANAKLLLAHHIECCHKQGVNEEYMQGLYHKAGGDHIDDDTDILTLYRILDRPLPVNLFFFNKMTMRKEKR